jgi:hypothetical protein
MGPISDRLCVLKSAQSLFTFGRGGIKRQRGGCAKDPVFFEWLA